MPAVQKLCVVCGDDLSAKKRTKDARGQYYCEPCVQKKAAQRAAAPAAEPVLAGAVGAPAAVAPPPADDGMLDLAPVREEKPKDVPMAACSACKKLLPERQVRNVNGDFICNACFAKQNQGKAGKLPAAGKPKMAKAAAEEESPSSELGFGETLMGGVLISLGLLAAAFGLRMGLYAMMPADGDTIGGNIGWAIFTTLYIAISSVVLIVSMVIAAQILGGITFGYIGSALYKSVIFFIGLSTFDFFVDRIEALGLFSFGFRFVLIAVAFILLFKIDAFEAFLLSAVNTALYWILGFALFMAATSLLSSRGDSTDRGPRDPQEQLVPDDDDDDDMPLQQPAAQPAAEQPAAQPPVNGGQ